MAKAITALSDKAIKSAKSKDKDYKLQDGKGLFLLIAKSGGKRWRLRYKFEGKEKLLALGLYPEISLAIARKMREDYREQIAQGIDPSQERKKTKEMQKQKDVDDKSSTLFSFKVLATALLDERLDKKDIGEAHYKRTITAFKNDVFPFIGDKHIKDVSTNDIKTIVTTIAKRGATESSRKAYYAISKTFRTLVTRDNPDNPDTNYSITNPPATLDLEDLVGKLTKVHYPTITDDKGIKALLLNIDNYSGDISTRLALKMLPYVFVRPFNIRHAEWVEIDYKNKQWNIPASKMKTKNDLIVPLTDTVIKILKEIEPYSGDGKYIFPSLKSKTTPMSDGTLLGAIRRLGYSTNEFTPHGFRAMFSTIANEKQQKYEAIETQLAHSVGSKVSQAYNRAKYLPERVELMQWWSDYLDEIQEREDG